MSNKGYKIYTTSGGISCSPGSKSRASMMPCSNRTQAIRVGSLLRSIQNFRWPMRNRSMTRSWVASPFSKGRELRMSSVV